jgi:hypothetical protein
MRRQHKWSAARITFELGEPRVTISRRTVSPHLVALGLNRRRFRASDLMMKWLWMLWRAGLWAGSYTTYRPNGTLPTVAAKLFSGTRVVSTPSLRICAEGHSAAAIADRLLICPELEWA